MLPPEREYLFLGRYDLQRLADLRTEEARLLLDNSYHSGAYYLLGYAVECALKACIARQTSEFEFPDYNRVRDSYNHDFRRLVVAADLSGDFLREHSSSQAFQDNWKIVMEWSTDSRYRHTISETTALAMLDAVTSNNGGILPWIKTRW